MRDFLKQFCAEPCDDARKWLHSPFSHEEFTYATNGHIMVRVPLIEGFEQANASNPKLGEHCATMFGPMATASFVKPDMSVPSNTETFEHVECDSCDGRGKEHDCPDCTCVCLDCAGSGLEKKVEKISTTFYGNIYRLKYIQQIVALPEIEIAPATVDANKSKPLVFRFQGGAGVLMARTKRCSRHVELAEIAA